MKITVVYDNDALEPGLKADWGFACVVEAHGRTILFDTGAKGAILLANMERLGIEPAAIDCVFISHSHWDHTGGLKDFLKRRTCPVYIPTPCEPSRGASEVIAVDGPSELHEGIFSTGTLKDIEQSLIVSTGGGAVVVVGCSHPGVGEILDAAGRIAAPRVLIGGLHGFGEFDQLHGLEHVYPLHCTKRKAEILSRYPGMAVAGGVGLMLEI
jgi:7,8-dihydropterin-6-yl-methyl-4-(beta-D-ribofuranosyl)aminobenzene 5'-phosphate synthase